MIQWISRRNILTLLLMVIALGVVVVLAWMVIAGPLTVLRVLRYGDTNIDDYSHYPGRELSPVAPSVPLEVADNALHLSVEDLEQIGAVSGLETYLQAGDTIAFLVLQDGAIVYDRTFQDHAPSSISQLFSVSKSVTSALVGMAITDGYFAGVDQSITDFIPELAAEDFDNVTIHHLLTMMSGSSYQENDNPFSEHVILNYTPRLEERILEFETEALPGTVFRYKSGDNALLGLALSRALAPETITQYAQRRLWAPLGMQDPGVWTIDHAGDGLEKTWCCLATSARNLARLGQLYLQEGAWDGAQILPSSWIRQSTTAQVPAEQWLDEYRAIGWRNYGYGWWLASEEDGDFFGLGKDGQFLHINPATNTVIVRLGWSQGELPASQWITLFQTVSRATQRE